MKKKKEKKRNTIVQTVVIIVLAIGVVFFWRGLWTLQDIFIWPEPTFRKNNVHFTTWQSGLISTIIGLIIVVAISLGSGVTLDF